VTGRYDGKSALRRYPKTFQSSPGLVTGRYMFTYSKKIIEIVVSILARSGDRALHCGSSRPQRDYPGFNPRPVW